MLWRQADEAARIRRIAKGEKAAMALSTSMSMAPEAEEDIGKSTRIGKQDREVRRVIHRTKFTGVITQLHVP